MVNYCAVYGCPSSKHDKDRKFFRFPKDDKERCRAWVKASNRMDLLMRGEEELYKSKVICDLHFEPRYRNEGEGGRLKRNAVPTLRLSEEEILFLTKSTQTDNSEPIDKVPCEETCHVTRIVTPSATTTADELSSSTLKRKLLFEEEIKKETNLSIESHHVATCSKSQEGTYMTPHLKRLINLKKKLQPHCHGNRYSKEFKLFALRVLFAGPTAYRVLSKSMCLPSEQVLRGMNINSGNHFFPNVIKCLESKLKHLKESGKYCVICADEIQLKGHLFYQINLDKVVGFHEIDGMQTTEPATQAFVLMARGVFQKWEQPLLYFFLAPTKNYDELNTWLNLVISEIIRIGFKVLAFVSNQETTFYNIASSRNVTPKTPYFYVNSNKIHYIFDVPNLLKSLRNILLKYDMEYEKDGIKAVASWADIERFYDHDKKRVYPLAPKLTKSHINPNNSQKKKLKYAAQVFSKSVAAGLSFSIELGQLDKKCDGTVKLIELINNTFDILNSSEESDANHSNRLPYQVETVNTFLLRSYAGLPYQRKTLNQFLKFINDVKILNTQCVEDVYVFEAIRDGFIISVTSIMSLWKDLKSEGNESIFTRRLNQDVLRDFFDSVRRQGGKCRAPSPVQFSRAFRKIFMVNMLKHSKTAHRKVNMDQLLHNLDEMVTAYVANHDDTLQRDDDAMITVYRNDYKFDLPEENTIYFVSGYLLKACHDIHKCEGIDAFVNSLVTIKYEISDSHEHYSVCEMLYPEDSFVDFVRELDKCVVNVFNGKELTGCLGKEILKAQSNINYDGCCPCFPNEYLKKLFVRFRIYNILVYNNRRLKFKSFGGQYISVPIL